MNVHTYRPKVFMPAFLFASTLRNVDFDDFQGGFNEITKKKIKIHLHSTHMSSHCVDLFMYSHIHVFSLHACILICYHNVELGDGSKGSTFFCNVHNFWCGCVCTCRPQSTAGIRVCMY